MARILHIASNRRGEGLEIEEIGRSDSDARYAVRLKSDKYLGEGEFQTAPWLPDPVKFFDELGAQWKGWQGEKAWQSTGSTLQLTATRDGVGHICLKARIRELVDPYSVTVPLYFDAGQLEELSNRVRDFFTAAETA